MVYLYAYLAIGAVVLVIIYVAHLISRKRESEFVRDMKDALYPERRKWRYRLLNTLVVPPLAALLVLAVWPVVFYMKGKELWEAKAASTPSEAEKTFAVTEEDLLERLSVQKIEARERIEDPMGAVPDRPFGHLNAAWLKFKASMEPTDSLSSFSARWSTKWGRKEILAGYVIVRDGRIGAHFLKARRVLNDE